MRKYRLAIYTDPEAKTVCEKELDEIGQGLILAKDWGHQHWAHCNDVRRYQWHIKLNEGFIDLSEIKLVIGRFTANGKPIITTIVEE